MNYRQPYKSHAKPYEGGQIPRVERAGYITTKQRVEQLILAGERLVAHRKAVYDFPDGRDTGEFDPTRSPNFDLADAAQIINSITPKDVESVGNDKNTISDTMEQPQIEVSPNA